jgi:hypothetical protein
LHLNIQFSVTPISQKIGLLISIVNGLFFKKTVNLIIAISPAIFYFIPSILGQFGQQNLFYGKTSDITDRLK